MLKKKDKRGTTVFLALMLAVVFFILGLALAPALNNVVTEQMDDPQLNCSTTTDSQTKAVCTSIDLNNLYVAIIFGIAGLLIARSV